MLLEEAGGGISNDSPNVLGWLCIDDVSDGNEDTGFNWRYVGGWTLLALGCGHRLTTCKIIIKRTIDPTAPAKLYNHVEVLE